MHVYSNFNICTKNSLNACTYLEFTIRFYIHVTKKKQSIIYFDVDIWHTLFLTHTCM